MDKRNGKRKKFYGTFLEFLSAAWRYLELPSSTPVRKALSYSLPCHISAPSSLFQCRNVLTYLLFPVILLSIFPNVTIAYAKEVPLEVKLPVVFKMQIHHAGV